jgi:ABC-type multidrug transport system ATPase subunit
MKTCPTCQTANAPEHKFCRQCGRLLDAGGRQPPPDATVRMTGTLLARGPLLQTYAVNNLFAAKTRVVIGRAPDCDICLAHPTVSRYHVLLERRPEGLWLRDLGSVNGVSVEGRRVAEEAVVRDGERVGIGPFLLSLTRGVLQSLDNSRGLRLEAHGLEKVVALPRGGRRKLLDNVSLVINPGEFVTLLGPSGSGKSTLMDCLNGRRPATGGRVLANGEDFYRHFDNFKQSLGYVPQRDIVHTQLSVARALYYTARLRLPTDTDPAELRARVEVVLKEMDLLPHRDTLVGDLSGGQIKRVSLGAELLAEPCLLYIDEATSGLDAGTEARMMRLFRRLADEGRSLICITHNVENVEQCHLVLVLARGKLVYYGPPREAPAYFKVARICDIYDRIGERDVADWEKEFAASSLCREFVGERLATRPLPPVLPPVPAPAPVVRRSGEVEAPATPEPVRPTAERRKLAALSEWPPLAEHFRKLTARYLRVREALAPLREQWHQFHVLTARYGELILGDRRGLRLLLLQAPIVAAFLLLGFAGKDFRQPMPITRPLSVEERRTLQLVDHLDKILADDRPINASQRKALRPVRFKVEADGKPLSLDGTQALALLRQLRRLAPDAQQRQAMEKARFTFESDGEEVSVRGADLLTAYEKLQRARLAEMLLAADGPVVPERKGVNARYTYMLLFIMAMIVLWFGCNNAAKEIVKEEAIYGRERAVNLGIVPYLGSKFLVLGVMTAFHALVLMVFVYGGLELADRLVPGCNLPDPQHMLDYPEQLGVMVLLALAGVALGLLLSACVATPDRANALLPYVLIPQMILGGVIIPVDSGALHYLAVTLSPVYWAFRAIHLGGSDFPRGFPGHSAYPDGVTLPCVALLLQTLLLLVATGVFLRRKDV